jgi:hypothetical protein
MVNNITSSHASPHVSAHVNGNGLAGSIESAIQWLVASGIQTTCDDNQLNGGYAAWFDEDTRSSPYLYAEITGYMLTLLTWLHDRHGDPRLLNGAVRAADWLVDNADEKTGGFRCLVPLAPSRFDYKRDLIFAFDCGVILSGLVNTYRATRRGKYLAAAVTVADWMLREWQDDQGAIKPAYNAVTGEWLYSNAEWSLCSGSYHTKVAMGLINLFDATGLARYRRAATQICDFALRFQQPNGRFITFPEAGGTNSHPHAYSAEGLWMVGKYLGREDYLQASLRATEWLFSVQAEDGLIPRHWHQDELVYNERVDVLSQALRLAEIHLSEGRLDPSCEQKMAKLVPVILRNQSRSEDPRVHGAFYFGRLSNGDIVRHANVWVSAFAIQSLMLRSDRQHGCSRLDPFFMV